ncbi:MAG: hypothetical protein J6H22_05480, partial [Pseudobutyrivibrio sp.]|nr:hypothetical protein [Pseudobutyrivibrio sp.]
MHKKLCCFSTYRTTILIDLGSKLCLNINGLSETPFKSTVRRIMFLKIRRIIKMANKWVYMFSEGDMTMRNLLGGKGANL